MGAVGSKDVVIAALGASAALAGFVLVFLGVVLTGLSSFPPETVRLVRRRYLRMAAISVAAFLISLMTVALGVVWLAYGQSSGVYHLMIWLFFVQLGLVFVVGVVTTLQAVGV
ncbi:MAG: hypothetical protein E6G40_05895 [Actinobacteria bacterium]|nr:MAG: hypothetical protein E6G40_05895 [Actinomycetota bacterium]